MENIVDGNACSYLRTSPRSPPSARRAARSAKAGLATLKYIATYGLTGVLQPIVGDLKRSLYVPKRQIQKCLMLLVLMGMICVTVGVTSIGHRTYNVTTSNASTMVTPLLISVAVSDIINCAISWYNFAINALSMHVSRFRPPDTLI